MLFTLLLVGTAHAFSAKDAHDTTLEHKVTKDITMGSIENVIKRVAIQGLDHTTLLLTFAEVDQLRKEDFTVTLSARHNGGVNSYVVWW